MIVVIQVPAGAKIELTYICLPPLHYQPDMFHFFTILFSFHFCLSLYIYIYLNLNNNNNKNRLLLVSRSAPLS
jgi:hypothetical protein